MDLDRSLRRAIETGDVVLGTKGALQAVEKRKAKLVVASRNPPPGVVERLQQTASPPPLFLFPGSNQELGTACGKPFSVGLLAVLDPGDSDILAAVKGGEGPARRGRGKRARKEKPPAEASEAAPEEKMQ
ncbi:MAG: 50S ribosomal protein L30e [Halobacteria archaeon]